MNTNVPLKETHLQLIRDLENTPDTSSGVKKELMILCTPRCGSTLFTDVLNNTNQIGFCDEWFNNEYFLAYCQVFNCEFNLKEYLNWVIRKTVRGTGVLAIKCHIAQLCKMHENFQTDIRNLGFDHIVYLERKDKIAQAVSLAKALKTDKFRWYEKEKTDSNITLHEISYALGIIVEQTELYSGMFSKFAHASYFYEDFVGLECPSYNEVLEALGKEPQHKLTTHMRKQRNGYSEKMTRKFKKYILGG